MKKVEVKTAITVYEDENELMKEDYDLLMEARAAAGRAYAIYSHFQVGAAILLTNGEVVTGNNQENSAYPSGLCAERTTAFYASSRYPNVPFLKIAITAINRKEKLTKPVTPCGACRQVLSEYEQLYKSPIQVLLAGEEGEVWKINSIAEILPLSFSSDFLPDGD